MVLRRGILITEVKLTIHAALNPFYQSSHGEVCIPSGAAAGVVDTCHRASV